MTEDRLVDIESRISFQEDAIQELNKVVYQQQKQIQRLEAICESLIDHVRELRDSAPQSGAGHERPPHY